MVSEFRHVDSAKDWSPLFAMAGMMLKMMNPMGSMPVTMMTMVMIIFITMRAMVMIHAMRTQVMVMMAILMTRVWLEALTPPQNEEEKRVAGILYST